MKRSLAIILCILLIIPVFAVCASASSAYTFEWAYSDILDDMGYKYSGDLPDGVYNLSISYNGDEYVSKEPITVQYDADGMIETEYEVVLVNFPFELEFVFGIIGNQEETIFGFSDYVEGYTIVLTPVIGEATAIPSVSDGLDAVIGWVGIVTTSLLSGSLASLLLIAAVPIAISVVLLTVKIIKKNSWGV